MQWAIAMYQRGERAEAERLCHEILAVEPDHFDALNLSGVIAAQAQRAQEAVELLTRAIVINPHRAEAHNNRGIALRNLKFHAAALESFERAIALRPGYAKAHNNRGVELADLKCHAAALESYERAIALEPDSAKFFNNRGNALRNLKSHTAALESYARAIALKPDYAEAYDNRGALLADVGRHRAALQEHEQAIALNPDYASAHLNLALCSLLRGDFMRGCEEYEWRWKEKQLEHAGRDFMQPLWLGAQPVDGMTVLLHSEQGLGDTLQFCRYAKLVAAMGAKVILEVQPPLLALLAGLEGVAQVLPKGAALPAFDYHCPLLSLPLAFKTALNSIPAGVPYIRSDPARVAAWQDALGAKSGPRVGLTWSGSATHKNDHNRSIPLSEMLPLVSGRAEWVSLQKDMRATDADVLASRTDIRHFGERVRDFADTAAFIELMDVVVTVDTGVAHLAGAMGKAVWILLPFNPDWRWLVDREDSPWYPTARLFRQPAIDDWASVIHRVRDALPQQHTISSMPLTQYDLRKG